jgi:predicted nucleic acid-binding protein
MRAALDTNVLAYAEGVGDPRRCDLARALVEQAPLQRLVLPAQVLGELYRVLTGKAGLASAPAREVVLTWSDAFLVLDSTWTAFQAAFDLAADHGLQIWDALILSVAAENRCRLLITEDLQHGFTWRGVTVIDPFATPVSPLLDDLVAAPGGEPG